MNNLYLFNYNNYYNRIVKFETTLQAYGTPVYTLSNISLWNPNDGVNTTQLVNTNVNCDYCIITKVEAGVESIDSRWFVIDRNRQRNGQWSYSLRRDLIAENYNQIITAPAFIEKAYVGNNDPAVFNKEGMTFNQIKQSETLLQDETKSAWVVGYIPQDSFKESTTIKSNVILTDSSDYVVEKLDDLPITQFNKDHFYEGKRSNVRIAVNLKRPTGDGFTYNYHSPIFFGNNYTSASNSNYTTVREQNRLTSWNNTSLSITIREPITSSAIKTIDDFYYYQSCDYMYRNMFKEITYDDYITNIFNDAANYDGCTITTNISDQEMWDYNNKIVHTTSDNKYYRINIKAAAEKSPINNIPVSSELYNYLNNKLTREFIYNGRPSYKICIDGTANEYSFAILTDIRNVLYVEYEQLNINAQTTLTSDRYHLNDQPYDMFCIPYSGTLEIYKNGEKLFNANKSIAVNMAVEIGHQAGSASVYDVQLLPYCPVRYMIKDDGTFDIGNSKVNFVTDGEGTNIGVICWATQSTFTFNINQKIEVNDYKMSNETDLYRLVSPNFNGQFEFSPAMNGGVDGFNVDCTYKPYNPYIHVNPNFNNYYGQDFNDARGLICGGDFSLPQISSAWANYEQNNKNYQQIFNREIQTMQTTNYFNNMQSQVNLLANSLGAGLNSGTRMGGGAAGLIGGVISGVSSLAGGAIDYAAELSLQGEALNYKYDMYRYNLGNIQALPTSLSKTTAITANNKIFPMIEYYTCTEVEKNALKNKIKYNGMSIGRIGTISEFLQDDYTYIKAQLIRLENIDNDTHYLNEVSNEVYKGGFFK